MRELFTHDLFESVFEFINDAIIVTDSEYKILFASTLVVGLLDGGDNHEIRNSSLLRYFDKSNNSTIAGYSYTEKSVYDNDNHIQFIIFKLDPASADKNSQEDYFKSQKLIAAISQKINTSDDIKIEFANLLNLGLKYFNCTAFFLHFDNSITDIFEKQYFAANKNSSEIKPLFISLSDFFEDLITTGIREKKEFINTLGLRQIIIEPIIAENGVIGITGFFNSEKIIKYPSGDMNLMDSITRNISCAVDRKLMLDKLRSSTALLNHYVEIAREGHFDINVTTGRVKFNKTGAEMLGYKFEDVEERSLSFWKSIVNQEDLENLRELYKEYIHSSLSYVECIIRIRSGSGRWVWTMMRCNALERDKMERPIRITGILIDITNQKQTEELLKQTIKTRDKMFSVIAHDLRSPIINMSNMLDLFIKSYENGSLDRSLFYNIKYSLNNTAELLDNLLNWSKLQIKTPDIVQENFNLLQVVREIESLYRIFAENKFISLYYTIPDNLFVYADINSVRLILRNLVNNALKFTLPGGIVKINAEEEGNNITISIIDNGVGMTESMIEIFNSSGNFRSSYGTLNEKGTGLGLTLCKEAATVNGGTIEVKSPGGKGTCFKVTLKKGDESRCINIQASMTETKNIFAGKTVLIVDDDSIIRVLISDILIKWDCGILSAVNGKEAVEIAETYSPDLIIMDLEMPVMDGYAAIKEIRNKTGPNIPVIALSSAFSDLTVKMVSEAGFDDYIVKPGSSSEIFEKASLYLIRKAQKLKLKKVKTQKNKANFVDWTKFSASLGNDLDALKCIIDKFLETTPDYYNSLIDSYEKGDLSALYSHSHKFKSSISLIATPQVIMNIETINRCAKDMDNSEYLKEQINNFAIWYPALCEELRNYQIQENQ